MSRYNWNLNLVLRLSGNRVRPKGPVHEPPGLISPGFRTLRRGMVLVIVLIVVAVLSLAAYSFTSLMLVQSESTQIIGRRTQARLLAASGVASLRAFLLQDAATRAEAGGVYDNPAEFQGVLVLQDAVTVEDMGKYTILAPALDAEGVAAGVRYGLEDECARVNLNALLMIEDQVKGLTGGDSDSGDSEAALAEMLGDTPETESLLDTENFSRDLLMGLPGMSVEIADAILDWLDEDDEPREFGAEVEYYSALSPSYSPKNGPLETVEELLLVRDVSPHLLFGLDVNRNGMVDLDEIAMAGELGDIPERGWASYFTLHSKEKNVNSFGEPRIDLNGDDLQALYDSLSLVFADHPDWVTFIIAYRQNGPYSGNEDGEASASGELNLQKKGETKFGQVLDLIGSKTQIQFQGDEETTVLRSPFSEDILSMGIYMTELMDNVTVIQGTTINGRINVNQAPREILLGIPGMTEEIVEQILGQRTTQPEIEDPTQQHETWLLTTGIVTLEEMKTMMPFVCAGGDTYRAQVVGYYEDGRASARVEVIIDATQLPPRLLLWRDISYLGRGYALETLGASLGITQE